MTFGSLQQEYLHKDVIRTSILLSFFFPRTQANPFDELKPEPTFFEIVIFRTTTVRDDRVIKAIVEVKSKLDQNVDVTVSITGGKFKFVDSKDGKCIASSKQSQKKSVQVAENGKSTCEFLFRLSEGEFELKAQGKAGNEIGEDTQTVRTYEETEAVEKYCDLRSNKFGSFYVRPPKDVEAYESIVHVTGNLFTELKFVDKLM
jgi:hypothetical protein